VLAGNMAPGGFDQFYLPRHIGLYAGVPAEVPALMCQRICGTGFELFRQAGEQIAAGVSTLALVVLGTGLTVVSGPLFDVTSRAAVELLDREPYVRAVFPQEAP
jgi:acetyl-CoA C-acetyltransferase